METGTYRGDTTAFLAKFADSVISIEPDPDLFRRANLRFKHDSKVQLVNDSSEFALQKILQGLQGPTCLWLDGHFSGAGTFLGRVESPILAELRAVEACFENLEPLVILIDDFRQFPQRTRMHNAVDGSYPSRDWLINWAQGHGMDWDVQHDIFIALKVPVVS